jgi:hypothetical protein
MDMRKIVVALLIAVGAAGAVPAAQAAVNVGVVIAPPAPRVEVAPAPRHGYAWAPGYWQWNGHKHVWHDGYWVRARPGYHWYAHNWEHRGDRYYYNEGHWVRD